MFKQNILDAVSKHFPNVKITSKEDSWLMKIIGKLMFFNKGFNTQFTTTLGNTIYFPTKNYVSSRPVSSLIILLHELVHVYDFKKYTPILFTILYTSPQIFALLALPALLISWKISLVLLLFLLPAPSFFRTHFEKRAYLVSLYVMKKLNDKYNYNINLNAQKDSFVKDFRNSNYYYMWPVSVLKEFDTALAKIEAGERPYQDDIFDILDEIIKST